MASSDGERDTPHRAGDKLATALHQGQDYLRLDAKGLGISEDHRRQPQLTSAGKSVISVGVIDEKSFTRESITRCLQALDDRFNIVPFATCEDFLSSTEGHDLTLYHIYEDTSKWHCENQKFLSFKKLLNLVPVIILSDIDNPDGLIELFESGARGFIPTANATVEQVIEIIGLVKVGGIFVPLSSLRLRKMRSRSVSDAPRPNKQFTSSELAILDHLNLGKANKIIAHELGVSESTVKVHIGRIMRKLKVTNRTQIVSRAYALTARTVAFLGEV
jgi:DNA-binding NarL/FixJ family response regulator